MLQFPEQISVFLLEFNRAVREKNWADVTRLYEHQFPTLSGIYYSNSRWPSADVVTQFYEEQGCHHNAVVVLYTELAMRHVYSNVAHSVVIEDRADSFDNYENLFDLMLRELCDDNRGNLPIPLKWLWGMMDEFVYQYHDTQRYKNMLVNQTNSTARIESEFAEVFDLVTVKGWLMSCIDRSGIRAFLKTASWNSEYTQKEQLGYFAMISLVRLHTLSADFYNALLVASDIPISTRAFYWKVPSANVSLFYHMGVSYIMLGRYIDAVKAMTPLLVFTSKSTHYFTSNTSYEMRTIERMYGLLKLADLVSPAPLRLDDGILNVIRDISNDKWSRLQGEDDGTFIAIFNRSMPKFIAPFRLTCVNEQRLDVFTHNLSHQLLEQLLEKRRLSDSATSVKTAAKLYSVLPLTKLAQLMFDTATPDSVEECRALTMSVKNHTTQNVLVNLEDVEDERPRQLQTDCVLVSGDLADFRLNHENIISAKSAAANEDKLERLEKAITQTNELLTQIRKIKIGSIPATFSLDAGEPVRMQRVKRGGDRKRN